MKKMQWIKWLLVSSVAAASIGAFTACKGNKAPEGFNGFIDGQTEAEVTLGDQLELALYIDYVQWDDVTQAWVAGMDDDEATFAEHEITFSKGSDVKKLTGRPTFDLDSHVTPGEWTLTYDITEDCDYEGTYTMTINVLAPDIEVVMTLDENNSTLYYGDTIKYTEVFTDINLDVQSYYDATPTFSQVVAGGKTISLANTTSYKLENLGKHVFTLSVKNTGGQTFTKEVTFNVVYHSIYSAAVYIPEGKTGSQEIPFDQTVSNVQINGIDVQAADMQQTSTGLLINNELLRQYPGACVVSFSIPSGEVRAANFAVYTGDVDFEDGVNNVLAGFGTYSQNGKDGKAVIATNVGAAGNVAVAGKANTITNCMNFNFDPYFLDAIFEGGAEYFSFDLLCDVPYLRWVREGGGWMKPGDADYRYKNTYLVADANDVGFGEYTDKISYNGKTLYRFSLVYPKSAWLGISNNGKADPENYLSTVVFDWSGEVDYSAKVLDAEGKELEERYLQTSQNILEVYIDNIRVGEWNADDVTFDNGVASGNFIISKAGTTGTGNSVVAFGDGYAMRHITQKRCKTNTTAFGVELGYLHQVFNVAGAKALQFKVYLEDITMVDKVTLYLSLYEYATRKDSAALTSTYDADKKCFTYTIEKSLYSTYFDADGKYISGSMSGLTTCSGLRLGMSSTIYKENAAGQADDYASGKGTVLYFDDFVKVMD